MCEQKNEKKEESIIRFLPISKVWGTKVDTISSLESRQVKLAARKFYAG